MKATYRNQAPSARTPTTTVTIAAVNENVEVPFFNGHNNRKISGHPRPPVHALEASNSLLLNELCASLPCGVISFLQSALLCSILVFAFFTSGTTLRNVQLTIFNAVFKHFHED